MSVDDTGCKIVKNTIDCCINSTGKDSGSDTGSNNDRHIGSIIGDDCGMTNFTVCDDTAEGSSRRHNSNNNEYANKSHTDDVVYGGRKDHSIAQTNKVSSGDITVVVETGKTKETTGTLNIHNIGDKKGFVTCNKTNAEVSCDQSEERT